MSLKGAQQSMKAALLWLLVLTSWCPTQGQDWKSFVVANYHKCCTDLVTKQCIHMDALSLGQDNNFYMFYNDFYMILKFRPNLYPQVEQDSFKPVLGNWGTLPKPQTTFIDTAHIYTNDMTISRAKKYYEYSSPGKQKGNEDGACEKHHPAFCQKTGQLRAIAVVKDDQSEPLIMAYYRVGGEMSTVFTVLGFRGNAAKPELQNVNVTGLMVAIDVFREDSVAKISHGIYFNSFGFGCAFSRPWSSKGLVLERTLSYVMADCYRMQTFIGCPQSYCFRNDMDDILEKSYRKEKKLIIFRGVYAWMMAPKQKPPFDVPKVDFGKRITGSKGPFAKLKDYIDAGESFLDADKRTEISVFSKDDRYWAYVDDVAVTAGSKITDAFPGLDKKPYFDTFWFNNKERLLFIFHKDVFWTYSVVRTGSALKWTLVGAKKMIVDYLYGFPTDIDGAISRSGKGYFIKHQWYLEVPEDKWSTKGTKRGYIPEVSINRLFNTKADCKFKDDEVKEMIERVRKYDGIVRLTTPSTGPTTKKPPATAKPPVVPPVKPPATTLKAKASTEERKKDKSGFWWWWILLLLLLLGLLVLLALFLVARKSKKEEEPKTASGTAVAATPSGMSDMRSNIDSSVLERGSGIEGPNSELRSQFSNNPQSQARGPGGHRSSHPDMRTQYSHTPSGTGGGRTGAPGNSIRSGMPNSGRSPSGRGSVGSSTMSLRSGAPWDKNSNLPSTTSGVSGGPSLRSQMSKSSSLHSPNSEATLRTKMPSDIVK